MERGAQDLAVSPAKSGRRKIVLATAIAETSLTIEGVRVVIDSGLSRVPRFEPDLGLTRLETVRVARAAADQRRAGQDARSPASATGCGKRLPLVRSSPMRDRKILSATFPPSCSIWRNGACATLRRSHGSIRRRCCNKRSAQAAAISGCAR